MLLASLPTKFLTHVGQFGDHSRNQRRFAPTLPRFTGIGAPLQRIRTYFSQFALQAARQWKFIPKEDVSPREWILRFEFTQTDTRVLAQRVDSE